jgi:NAD(P)-dependent dehydrogenase (short-subunit alcohol dehydrogenase family)
MRSPLDAFLDTTVYFSFDGTGFRRHAKRFDASDLDVDLAGKRCLITGGNSGIGFATAEALARLGARVDLLCRNPERGAAAVATLRERTGSDEVHLEVLDVSDLDAIRDWAASVEGAVDVLIHNAGSLPSKRALTAAGLETTFATHVVGPFLLTHLLRPRLESAPAPRVLWVSSGGMYTQRLSLDDLDWSRRKYDGVVAYAQTKRMQVVLSELFAEHLGPDFCVHAMHPGWADTPGVRDSLPGFWRFTQGRLRSSAEGADTLVWLAAADTPSRSTGGFYFDRQQRSTHLLPGKRARPGDRRRLWELCARLTNLETEA